jgi:F-type H+/Na+-transporting ATPase subunit alpha
LDHGERIRALLKQPELSPVSVPEQILLLLALTHGLFDDIPLEEMKAAEAALRSKGVPLLPAELLDVIQSNNKMSAANQEAIVAICSQVLAADKKETA